jgi:hypothetical protein
MKSSVSPSILAFRVALLASVFSLASPAFAAEPFGGITDTPAPAAAATGGFSTAAPVQTGTLGAAPTGADAATAADAAKTADASKDACKDANASDAPNADAAKAMKAKCERPHYESMNGMNVLSQVDNGTPQGLTPSKDFQTQNASSFNTVNGSLSNNVQQVAVKNVPITNASLGSMAHLGQLTGQQSIDYSLNPRVLNEVNSFQAPYANLATPYKNDTLSLGMAYGVNSNDPKAPLRQAFMNTMIKEYGMTPTEAAAYAGNIDHESNAFDPQKLKYDPDTHTFSRVITNTGEMAQGDYKNPSTRTDPTSFGIAQFHNSRATDMFNFVGAQNGSKQELKGTLYDQWDYMGQEDIGNQSKALNAAGQTDNLKTATGVVTTYYEAPKAVANDLYGRMGGSARYNNATAALNEYNANQGNSSGSGGYFAPVTSSGGKNGTGATLSSGGGSSGGGIVSGGGSGGFSTGNPVIDSVLGVGNRNTTQLNNLPGMLNTGNTQLSSNPLLGALGGGQSAGSSGSGSTGTTGTATRPVTVNIDNDTSTLTEVTTKDGVKTTTTTKTDNSGKVLESTTTTEKVDEPGTVTKVTVKDGVKITTVTKTDSTGKVLESTTKTEKVDAVAATDTAK